jgi:hypothetical protein
VTQLGELLAALHGASEVRTVRATIRTWTHLARRREAFLADAENVVTAIAISDRPVPVVSERVERVWRAFPGLGRVEGEDSLDVRRGGLWWSWTPGRAVTNDGDTANVQSEAGLAFDHLLQPWPLVSALRFAALGGGERAGRPALLARAVPVAADDDDRRPWPPWPLPRGADEHLLAVDRERGTLLELVSRRGGEDLERLTVEEIAYDEPLVDELFVFRSPDGTRPAPLEHEHIEWHTSVREVAARAPFTLYLPREVPEAWRLRVNYRHEPPEVYLLYRSLDAATGVTLTERAAGGEREQRDALDEPGAWRDHERSGAVYRVREPSESWADTLVRTDRGGTEVELASHDVSLDELLDLAEGLQPVRAAR